MPFWTVALDDDREGFWKFDNERDALLFAEFDSQLEDATAVVMRFDDDGTATAIRSYVRV